MLADFLRPNSDIVEDAIAAFGEEADTIGFFHARMKKFIAVEVEEIAELTLKVAFGTIDEFDVEEDFNLFEMIMVAFEDMGILDESNYEKVGADLMTDKNFVDVLKSIVTDIYNSIEFD